MRIVKYQYPKKSDNIRDLQEYCGWWIMIIKILLYFKFELIINGRALLQAWRLFISLN